MMNNISISADTIAATIAATDALAGVMASVRKALAFRSKKERPVFMAWRSLENAKAALACAANAAKSGSAESAEFWLDEAAGFIEQATVWARR